MTVLCILLPRPGLLRRKPTAQVHLPTSLTRLVLIGPWLALDLSLSAGDTCFVGSLEIVLRRCSAPWGSLHYLLNFPSSNNIAEGHGLGKENGSGLREYPPS